MREEPSPTRRLYYPMAVSLQNQCSQVPPMTTSSLFPGTASFPPVPTTTNAEQPVSPDYLLVDQLTHISCEASGRGEAAAGAEKGGVCL